MIATLDERCVTVIDVGEWLSVVQCLDDGSVMVVETAALTYL